MSPAPLRVLHLTRDLPPATKGGISTSVHALAQASAGFGVEAAVASFDGYRPRSRPRAADTLPAPVDEGGLRVLRLCGPADLPALRPFAEAFRPRLLHVHHGMLWEAAAELRAALGVPALKTVHVLQAESQRLRGLSGTNLSLAAQRRALAEADAVHVPSRAAADILLRDHPGLAARLTALGFGVQDSEAARRAAARERPFAPRLLAAGRFADTKGTGELLAAWELAAPRLPGASLCLAGGVPDNRRGEARWRKRVAALGPSGDRVRLPGWLDAEALSGEYAAAEVLACPGWCETFGLTALEGMLHGLPVVACGAGGLGELVAHDHTGLLVPPREPRALAAALLALLADPDRARKLGRAAAAEARAGWSWARLGPRWAALYAALAGRGLLPAEQAQGQPE